jgi:hypothetical protein
VAGELPSELQAAVNAAASTAAAKVFKRMRVAPSSMQPGA